MRKLLTILLLLLSLRSKEQSYVLQWTASGQVKDSVQQSTDSIHFSTISVINGGVDSCVVPNATYYYQIKANTLKSNVLLVTAVHGKIKNISAVQYGSNLIRVSSKEPVKIYNSVGQLLTEVTGESYVQVSHGIYFIVSADDSKEIFIQ